MIWLINCYQKLLSPWLGQRCRFYPSCSEYSKQAIMKHGYVRGVFKSVCRLLKCHPFHPGGFDPL